MVEKNGIFYWEIPRGLNFELLLQLNPPTTRKKKYKIDVFYYIIDLVSSRDMSYLKNPDSVFVEIHSNHLQYISHDYKDYINYLLENGMLSRDYYIADEKSFGYCLNFQSIDVNNPIQLIPLKDNSIIKKISQDELLKSTFAKAHLEYSHLTQWFNPKLKIDSKKAEKYLLRMNESLNAPNLSKKEKKELQESIFCNSRTVHDLKNQNFYYKIDNNIGRFHSNLTTLKKELRNYITYDGRKLVNIDVRNSQPFLSTVLMTEEFWSHTHSGLNIFKFPTAMNIVCGYPVSKEMVRMYGLNHYEGIDKLRIGTFTYTMSVTFWLKSLNKDSIDYISFAKSSQFYKKVFKKVFPDSQFDKAKAKGTFFKYIYSSNKQNYWKEKRLISEAFPSVTFLFESLKRSDYVLLSHVMQRLESTLMIEVVSRRIAAEKPNLPFFTVHDSIATFPEEVEYVKRVIKEEFQRYLGITPKLGQEKWGI